MLCYTKISFVNPKVYRVSSVELKQTAKVTKNNKVNINNKEDNGSSASKYAPLTSLFSHAGSPFRAPRGKYLRISAPAEAVQTPSSCENSGCAVLCKTENQNHAMTRKYASPTRLYYPMVYSVDGVSLAGLPTLCRFFSFLAHRRPQALQSVLGPLGPFRHSGESMVPVVLVSTICCQKAMKKRANKPQSVQTYSSTAFNRRFFFSAARPSGSLGMAMPASPVTRDGLVLPVVIP